jgi:dinuclear metal center YbgI/SA1388 family protein
MKIKELLSILEEVAPLSLQEPYDNSGLIVGDPNAVIQKVLVCLDVTEAVVDEAVRNNCGLIVSHHPIIFKGLKSLVPRGYVERTVIQAIRHDVAIASMHTNLDNSPIGVNKRIADKLDLIETTILEPKEGLLRKIITYVPQNKADTVRQAMFEAGAGSIGNYDSCSFNVVGEGTFKANSFAKPFVGQQDKLHTETEMRIEVVVPHFYVNKVIEALLKSHPYEEVAYDVYSLENSWRNAGSGMVGFLKQPMHEKDFLDLVRSTFDVPVLRHSPFLNKIIHKVAVCGGSGAFLLPTAKRANAEAFITADIKYHDFFDADKALFMVDAGHFETEQFTKELIADILRKKIPNFAVLFSEVNTNAVGYYFK